MKKNHSTSFLMILFLLSLFSKNLLAESEIKQNLINSPINLYKNNTTQNIINQSHPPKRANNPKDFGQFHFGDENADEKREAEKRETIYELDLGGGVKFGVGGDFLQPDPNHPVEIDDVNGFLKYNKQF